MRKVIFVLFIAILAISCNKNRIYSDFQDIKKFHWYKTDIKSFNVNVTDTVSTYKQIIGVRHSTGIPYSSLKFTVTTTAPDGKKESKEYKISIKDKMGQNVGEGAGDIWDIEVPVLENYKFKKAGNYKFEIEHAMPKDPVQLIMEIGFIIDKEEQI